MLFKYYSPESFDFIFNDNGLSIRASQSTILNDPFELKSSPIEKARNTVQFFREMKIENYKIVSDTALLLLEQNLKGMEDDFIKSWGDNHNKSIDRSFGVVSLSDNKCSRPMWSYYAKDNTGFMVCFDTLEQSENVRILNGIEYSKVKYSNKRPSLPIDEPDNIYHQVIDDYYMKDDSWEHEKEFRAIVKLSDFPAKMTDAKGFPIHCLNAPPEAICYIVLGCRASDALERRILFWIEQNAPNVSLYKAQPYPDIYDFEYVKLT